MTQETKATKERVDPAQSITDEIVALLEQGTLPWRRPWRIAGGGVPLRVGGESYRGINAFLLGLRAALAGHRSPYWMTYQQAKALGAQVRKGARSSVVIYYGTAVRSADAPEGGDAGGATAEAGRPADGEPGAGGYRFLKSYRVFNAGQVDGLGAAFHPEAEGDDDPEAGPEPIPEAEAILRATGADVVFGGARACYIPSLDRIYLPERRRFESAGAFLATWAHELAHWTKTEERLDRSFGPSAFGNKAYAKEELVAELSAVLLGQRLGFAPDHLDNHAAYLGSWLRVLRGDKRFLLKAGSQAQRVADFLLGPAPEPNVPGPAAAAGASTTPAAEGAPRAVARPAAPDRAPAAA